MTDFEDDLDLGDISPEEREEAAALMAALEREHDGGLDTSEPLVTASLLQYARSSELHQTTHDSVLADILKEARRPEAEPTWWQGWSRWAGAWRWMTAVGAVAVVAFLVVGSGEHPVVQLPGPSIALLQAQASVAAGGDANELDAAMLHYRVELLASLEAGGQ